MAATGTAPHALWTGRPSSGHDVRSPLFWSQRCFRGAALGHRTVHCTAQSRLGDGVLVPSIAAGRSACFVGRGSHVAIHSGPYFTPGN